MLQTPTKPRPLAETTGTGIPGFESPAEMFRMATGFLRRQYPVLLLALALAMGVGIAYVMKTPPSYTAEAKLLIDTRKLQPFQQQEASAGEGVPDTAWIDSQVEILWSENVALSVIKRLHLTEDPEFISPRPGLVSSIVSYTTGLVMGLFESSGGAASEFSIRRAALETLQSKLQVKRVGLTYIIEIDFRSGDPDKASRIANAVADAYIVDQLESKYQTTRRAGVWLQDRIKELREQATAAERAVVDFRAKNNIVDTGGRLMNEQQLVELNSGLMQARAQTAEAKARLERINQITTSDIPEGAVTDSLKNDVITKLRDQYMDFSRKEADWSRRYGSNHLAAVNMRNQMAEIRRNIVDELNRIAQSYKSDYEIAKAREDSVSKTLGEIVSQSQTTNQAQIALHELESTAQTYRALHDNFLQRYMESVQQQSFPITEARVITEATPPQHPSNPRTRLILAAGAAGGLVLGFGMGLLREMSDRVFRTAEQVEHTLQTDCIAVVPRMKTSGPKDASRTRSAGLDRRIIDRDRGLFWNVVDAPFSRFAESMRAIKLAADAAGTSGSRGVIAITSSLPNEGKSTMSMALAQSIASGGARVILLDADLRNPGLSRKLAEHAKIGLLDVLAGRVAIQDALLFDPATRLTFLPAVMHERTPHSSQLLASEPMRLLMDRLRQSYDYVIVDLSPLAPVVDVRAMTHLVDCFVLVVEWGRTKIDVVERALKTARGVSGNLLGVVLNKTNLSVLRRYGAYRDNYYFNRYYARYGYTD
jgi:succinoglycan biosynthesis transport protein ExoP